MIALKKLTFAVFGVNLVLMTYTAFIFIFKVPKESNLNREDGQRLIDLINYNDSSNIDYSYWGPLDNGHVKSLSNNERSKQINKKSNEPLDVIEIWSKAAIGNYLWEHILKGKLSKKSQFYQYGFRKIDRFKVKFRSGPSLTPQSLENFISADDKPREIKNLIFVLNGRSKEKIEFAKQWLDKIQDLTSRKDIQPFNAAVILLGHEFCFNNWVKKYLNANGGPLKFLFVVYDWKEINEEDIYQWPLGVATYRNFPNPDPNKLNLKLERPYTCNFLGTIYPNSSRVEVMDVIKTFDERVCFTKGRSEWEPNETSETLELYLQALRLSDLTLSPIGMNHECYRIYEALSYGSLPVVEENLSHVKGHKSNCDSTSAYRLLKKYDAPVIYIANWTHELPMLIEKEMSLSLERKIERRLRLIDWYASFKTNIRNHLFDIIEQKFKLKF
ncbi:ribitol-5-phosphate xylosyltransferase 1-like [Tetranychus urticae]|uniref:Transmembrane protein 5 n=1 Tax=Tetranychus urticae TaxID=32264 RepID=T1JT51_TETUR|nr:ribitol-5-phosphate xylosyltransferase 1-like [Tetranychus urticae]